MLSCVHKPPGKYGQNTAWHSPSRPSINNQQVDGHASYKAHPIKNLETNCFLAIALKECVCLFSLEVKTVRPCLENWEITIKLFAYVSI